MLENKFFSLITFSTITNTFRLRYRPIGV